MKGREAGAGHGLRRVASGRGGTISGHARRETPASPGENVPQGTLELPARSVEETPPVTATAYTHEAEPSAEAPVQQARTGTGREGRTWTRPPERSPDAPQQGGSRERRLRHRNGAQENTRERKRCVGHRSPPRSRRSSKSASLPGLRRDAAATVVTVTKEHWSTTSARFENAGAMRPLIRLSHHG